MNGFRHEAVFYDGQDDFFARVIPFLREGAESDDAMLVALPEPRLGALKAELQTELGADTDRITFADMTIVGRNPGRILSLWNEVARAPANSSGRARGVGEPIWPGRSSDEIAECEIHEDLLGLALGGFPLHLLCPYDAAALPSEVVARATTAHNGRPEPAAREIDLLAAPLRPAPEGAHVVPFAAVDLRRVRAAITGVALHVGLAPVRIADLVLAVDEIATNSLRHGGGSGTLRTWIDGDAVVCEVTDRGQIRDPLVGRRKPGFDSVGGRGLWLVQQLCDLVQIRSDADGSVVRVRIAGSRVP